MPAHPPRGGPLAARLSSRRIGPLSCQFEWSGRRDSNPRPSPWQGDSRDSTTSGTPRMTWSRRTSSAVLCRCVRRIVHRLWDECGTADSSWSRNVEQVDVVGVPRPREREVPAARNRDVDDRRIDLPGARVGRLLDVNVAPAAGKRSVEDQGRALAGLADDPEDLVVLCRASRRRGEGVSEQEADDVALSCDHVAKARRASLRPRRRRAALCAT